MQLVDALKSIGFGPELVTFIVSMIPVVELRGAIPIGVYLGLPVWKAFVISVMGNLIPAPFIIAFCRWGFDFIRSHIRWLSNFVSKLEAKAEKNRAKVEKGEFWGLLAFVAIPLPGTGAWTGALVASLLDMRLKNCLPAITLGVLIAGGIVMAVTFGVISVGAL